MYRIVFLYLGWICIWVSTAIAEPLVFHWSQAQLKINSAQPVTFKTILRSRQQEPVNLKSSVTLKLYARTRNAGRLRCNLGILDLENNIPPDEQSTTSCMWNLSEGASLQASFKASRLDNISVATAAVGNLRLQENNAGQILIPVTHEVPLDISNLDWLEELTVLVTCDGDSCNKYRAGKIYTHLQHCSGQLIELNLRKIIQLTFCPRFFSLLVDPDASLRDSELTEKLVTDLLERELVRLNTQLKALIANEPSIPTPPLDYHFIQPDEENASFSEQVQLFKQLQQLLNHYIEVNSTSQWSTHRYHLSTPVYPVITIAALDQCKTKRDESLHIDSWGDLTGTANLVQKLTPQLQAVIADARKPSHNQRIGQHTYPAVILDTDLREPLVGQLGLFARQQLPLHTCLGAYGGILLHRSEHKHLDDFFDSQVDDYIHEADHRVDKKLLISPYQMGNLLSLINTDRLSPDQPDERYPRNITKVNLRSYGINYVIFVTQQVVPKDAELFIEYSSDFLKDLRQATDDVPMSDDDNDSIISASSEAPEDYGLISDAELSDEELCDDISGRKAAEKWEGNPYRRNNYQCLICDEKKDPYEIVYHHLACHNEPVFICPNWHCFQIFKVSDIDKYLQHIRESKEANQKNYGYCCKEPDCHYATSRTELYNSHIKELHKTPVARQPSFRQDCDILQRWNVHWTQLGKGIISSYNCPLCESKPDGKAKLVKHIASNHATPCMCCPVEGCTSIFTKPEYWVYHVKMIRSVGRRLGLKICDTENCHHIYARKSAQHTCKALNRPDFLPASCPARACKETFYSKQKASDHIEHERKASKHPIACEAPFCHFSDINLSRLKRHNGDGCTSSQYLFESIPASFYHRAPRLVRNKGTLRFIREWKQELRKPSTTKPTTKKSLPKAKAPCKKRKNQKSVRRSAKNL